MGTQKNSKRFNNRSELFVDREEKNRINKLQVPRTKQEREYDMDWECLKEQALLAYLEQQTEETDWIKVE